MRSVAIGDLKNKLSQYLDAVRKGEEIVVRDRWRPIAKIVPLTGADGVDAEERALAGAGLVRLPEASFSRGFWTMRAPCIDSGLAAAAVSADRDEDSVPVGVRKRPLD